MHSTAYDTLGADATYRRPGAATTGAGSNRGPGQRWSDVLYKD